MNAPERFRYPMYDWARDLYPIHRHLIGDGVRQTLQYLQDLLPTMQIHSVPSGTQVFDWIVPQEWRLHEARIEAGGSGAVFRVKPDEGENLGVVQYSEPVQSAYGDGYALGWDELKSRIHHENGAVPYVTSYYQRTWGFCMTSEDMARIARYGDNSGLNGEPPYRVRIDSEFFDGTLDYGELVIPGELEDEILLSTYICHPSMANDNVSGMVVLAALAQHLLRQRRRYTYRIIFVPETIGSLAYMARNLEHLRKHVIAGYVLSNCGDERDYSYVATRRPFSLSDRAIEAAYDHLGIDGPKIYSFCDRGSDERQFNAPGADLPIGTVCRSKFGTYPEYHTSADNLDLISQTGLEGTLTLMQTVLKIIEVNRRYRATCIGEPMLSRRELYPGVSTSVSGLEARTMMNFLAYADGMNDLINIGNFTRTGMMAYAHLAPMLIEHGLLQEVP